MGCNAVQKILRPVRQPLGQPDTESEESRVHASGMDQRPRGHRRPRATTRACEPAGQAAIAAAVPQPVSQPSTSVRGLSPVSPRSTETQGATRYRENGAGENAGDAEVQGVTQLNRDMRAPVTPRQRQDKRVLLNALGAGQKASLFAAFFVNEISGLHYSNATPDRSFSRTAHCCKFFSKNTGWAPCIVAPICRNALICVVFVPNEAVKDVTNFRLLTAAIADLFGVTPMISPLFSNHGDPLYFPSRVRRARHYWRRSTYDYQINVRTRA